MAAAVLVTLRAEEVEQEAQVITYALANAKSRVYLYLTGELEQSWREARPAMAAD